MWVGAPKGREREGGVGRKEGGGGKRGERKEGEGEGEGGRREGGGGGGTEVAGCRWTHHYKISHMGINSWIHRI